MAGCNQPYVAVCQAKLKFGPIAEKNHNGPDSLAGCDPDYGWSDGADGSGKCYMLIKDYDYRCILGTIQKLRNPLRERGEVSKRLHKITRGEGGIHQKIT